MGLTRAVLVAVFAAALGAPSVASAGSIHGLGFHRIVLGWTSFLSERVRQRNWHNNTPTPSTQPSHEGKDCPPDRAVPEPTAALLFGLGAAVVATRTRKRS
jgi:hypothetical protein